MADKKKQSDKTSDDNDTLNMDSNVPTTESEVKKPNGMENVDKEKSNDKGDKDDTIQLSDLKDANTDTKTSVDKIIDEHKQTLVSVNMNTTLADLSKIVKIYDVQGFSDIQLHLTGDVSILDAEDPSLPISIVKDIPQIFNVHQSPHKLHLYLERSDPTIGGFTDLNEYISYVMANAISRVHNNLILLEKPKKVMQEGQCVWDPSTIGVPLAEIDKYIDMSFEDKITMMKPFRANKGHEPSKSVGYTSIPVVGDKLDAMLRMYLFRDLQSDDILAFVDKVYEYLKHVMPLSEIDKLPSIALTSRIYKPINADLSVISKFVEKLPYSLFLRFRYIIAESPFDYKLTDEKFLQDIPKLIGTSTNRQNVTTTLNRAPLTESMYPDINAFINVIMNPRYARMDIVNDLGADDTRFVMLSAVLRDIIIYSETSPLCNITMDSRIRLDSALATFIDRYYTGNMQHQGQRFHNDNIDYPLNALRYIPGIGPICTSPEGNGWGIRNVYMHSPPHDSITALFGRLSNPVYYYEPTPRATPIEPVVIEQLHENNRVHYIIQLIFSKCGDARGIAHLYPNLMLKLITFGLAINNYQFRNYGNAFRLNDESLDIKPPLIGMGRYRSRDVPVFKISAAALYAFIVRIDVSHMQRSVSPITQIKTDVNFCNTMGVIGTLFNNTHKFFDTYRHLPHIRPFGNTEISSNKELRLVFDAMEKAGFKKNYVTELIKLYTSTKYNIIKYNDAIAAQFIKKCLISNYIDRSVNAILENPLFAFVSPHTILVKFIQVPPLDDILERAQKDLYFFPLTMAHEPICITLEALLRSIENKEAKWNLAITLQKMTPVQLPIPHKFSLNFDSKTMEYPPVPVEFTETSEDMTLLNALKLKSYSIPIKFISPETVAKRDRVLNYFPSNEACLYKRVPYLWELGEWIKTLNSEYVAHVVSVNRSAEVNSVFDLLHLR